MDLNTIAERNVDLGPKSGAQLFQIPQEHWTAINKRAFFVVAPGPYAYTHYSRLHFYAELRAQAINWREQIFPQIKSYFDAYVELSAKIVGTWYPQLAGLFAAMRQGALTPAQQQDFQSVVQAIQAAVQPLKERSNKLAPMIAAFRDVNLKADQAIGSELGVNPQALETAVNTVNDDWDSMDEDLNFLMNEIYPKLSAGAPIVVQVNMEIALSGWQQLSDEIKGFGTVTAAQQQYIDGNFPYMLWVKIPESELVQITPGDVKNFKHWNYAVLRWAQQNGYALGLADFEKFPDQSGFSIFEGDGGPRIGVPSDVDIMGLTYSRGAVVFSKAFSLAAEDVDVFMLKTMFPGMNFPGTNFWDDSIPPFKIGYAATLWALSQGFAGAVPSWDSGNAQSPTERLYGFKPKSGVVLKDIPTSELYATFPGVQINLNDEPFWAASIMRWATQHGYAAGIPDWRSNDLNSTKGAWLFPADWLG